MESRDGSALTSIQENFLESLVNVWPRLCSVVLDQICCGPTRPVVLCARLKKFSLLRRINLYVRVPNFTKAGEVSVKHKTPQTRDRTCAFKSVSPPLIPSNIDPSPSLERSNALQAPIARRSCSDGDQRTWTTGKLLEGGGGRRGREGLWRWNGREGVAVAIFRCQHLVS